jgi:hypothetical protein
MAEMVQPLVAEFIADPDSVRRGLSAAVFLNQLVDYLWHGRPGLRGSAKSEAQFRDALAIQCPAFGVVRDVADAAKHVTLTRSTAQLRNLDSLQAHPSVFDPRVFDPNAFQVGDVVVAWPDGTTRSLRRAVSEALRFLSSHEAATRPSG